MLAAATLGRQLTEFGKPLQNPKGFKASSIRLPEL
jgi:hypothetical protein